ncbi:MAG: hydroxysqualene dehydroxylase HpnE [Pirellulaceae bacterium]
MSPPPPSANAPSVAIVGGGLAGLAAATILCQRGLHVTLLEAKRRLGGRAGSYLDRTTGERIDHCQHVAMGCCTNYLDFCRRTGIGGLLARHDTLHFLAPDASHSRFRPTAWLPAPLHLVPALLGLAHLSWGEKVALGRAVWRLVQMPAADRADAPTVLAWLHAQGQPPRAIERFWQAVLVSALGESLERASLAAARKVLLDGFVAHPQACQLLIPTVPLDRLYQHVAEYLRGAGAILRLETTVEQVTAEQVGGDDARARGIRFADGQEEIFDYVVLATPWRKAAGLLAPALREQAAGLEAAAQFAAAPISGVHLWFDRPITDLPHAVLVGRLSQWVFARRASGASADSEHYYQVVISASHDLVGRDRQAIVREVLADLAAVFPAAQGAQLLRWQLVTEPEAVFSVRPGLDQLRPAQRTAVANLMLAGDWTATGWPATMEGAVRSGYLAAEGVLAAAGRAERVLVADLPRGWLLKGLGIGDVRRR